MKITALKSGPFAHPDPSKKTIVLTEGEEVEVDGKMAAALIETEWGEPYVEPEDKPLSRMNKGELIELAEKLNVDLSDASNNEDRRALIEKAQENG